MPASRKGPEQTARTLSGSNVTVPYGVGGGPTEIGFGGAGAVGAVNPGITGAEVITPVAASVMLML